MIELLYKFRSIHRSAIRLNDALARYYDFPDSVALCTAVTEFIDTFSENRIEVEKMINELYSKLLDYEDQTRI